MLLQMQAPDALSQDVHVQRICKSLLLCILSCACTLTDTAPTAQHHAVAQSESRTIMCMPVCQGTQDTNGNLQMLVIHTHVHTVQHQAIACCMWQLLRRRPYSPQDCQTSSWTRLGKGDIWPITMLKAMFLGMLTTAVFGGISCSAITPLTAVLL